MSKPEKSPAESLAALRALGYNRVPRASAVLRGKERESFALSTKVGRLLVPTPGLPRLREKWVAPLQFRMRYDYSEKAADDVGW